MRRRQFLMQAMGTSSVLAFAAETQAKGPVVVYQPSVVIAWNGALKASIAASFWGPTVAARAISMVFEAAYNAWAAYDPLCAFTLGGIGRRPAAERLDAWKTVAVSHAAHDVLVDLFPTRAALFDQLLAASTATLQPGLPAGIAAMQTGQLAAALLLQARHHDGSNQLGDLAPGAYADYTGYVSVNTPDLVVDPLRWQPLRITNAQGVTMVQKFLSPHWGRVRPFALPSGSALRPAYSPLGPTTKEMDQLLKFSASLNDKDKATIDFFANNPGSVTPPGQWMNFAEVVSSTDQNDIDDDVQLFFAAGQAGLDASIAAWDVKRVYDSVRPITAIRYFYCGQMIESWGGPGNGKRHLLGQDWAPYQRPSNPSPPFPEFVSGHSTFSAAAAAVMAGLRGDKIKMEFTFAARGIPFDSTVPDKDVKLHWNSLSDVADAAGLSRRLGGIHFEQGDLKGRALGARVGSLVLARCNALFAGQG